MLVALGVTSYESAPASDSNPAAIQATTTRGAAPTSCIIEAERTKIPVPTIEFDSPDMGRQYPFGPPDPLTGWSRPEAVGCASR